MDGRSLALLQLCPPSQNDPEEQMRGQLKEREGAWGGEEEEEEKAGGRKNKQACFNCAVL